MFLRLSPTMQLIVAVTLEVAGGLVIIFSLPAGGPPLWLGVALIAVGSLAMRGSVSRMNAERKPEAAVESAAQGEEIEPELKKPAPRSVKLTARGNLIAAVWLLLIGLTGALAYQHFNRLPPPRMKPMLTSEGASADAVIHRKEVREIEGGRTLYTIGYNFTDESGMVVRSSATLSRAVFESVSEGERLEVIYFPPNPSLHYFPEITSPISTRAVWMGLAVLAIGAGLTDAQRRMHKKLIAEGRAVSGFIANVRRRGGVRSFLVNYDVAGERQTVKASERNAGLENGQSATILYDPGRADRAVIYRLALYRAR